ncbi:MAG: hypothetical protein L0G70_02425 [Rubrobacter sp.]|nr:hypothetical protein [Rubrobacter sp.]
MEISSHPSVDELRAAVHARGAMLACTVCRHEEFSIEEAEIRGIGGGQYLGNHRLPRAQIVCENCGHVMSFEVRKLQ